MNHRRRKTDAQQVLDILKAYVLAGTPLPDIWVPDMQTRDDRELVRARLEVGDKLTRVKTQVQSLLKHYGLRRPADCGKGWSVGFRRWLTELTQSADRLGPGSRATLGSLLRQLKSFIITYDRP